MLSPDQIKAQLAELGIKGIKANQEGFKALSEVLRDNERVEAAVAGTYEGLYGAAVATDQRVVFIGRKPGLLGKKLRTEDFLYSAISSVQIKQGTIFGSIEVYASGNKAEIDKVANPEAMKFAEHVKHRMTIAKTSVTTSIIATDVATQLEKLATLHAQGILTDEEFQTQKQKLLSM